MVLDTSQRFMCHSASVCHYSPLLANALYTIKEWNATIWTSRILGSEVLSNCLSTVFNCTFRLHYPWGHLSSMVGTSQHSLEFGCHLFHLGEGSLKRVVIGLSPFSSKADWSKFKLTQDQTKEQSTSIAIAMSVKCWSHYISIGGIIP